jgi:starvation-inducible DNA-binding protein
MILYGYYNKYLWLVRDQTFHELHLLFEKHAGEQEELIDLIVERVRTLGGVPTVPRQVAELAAISRPSNDVEDVPEMMSRLLEAHELIIDRIRDALTTTATSRDDGSKQLLANMLRLHELQAWSIAEQLGDTTARSA